jgi:peroxiredoxin (alkyl hydroperoxide reductase subunit C)
MWRSAFFLTLAACMTPPKARAEVLGPCGTPDAQKPAALASRAAPTAVSTTAVAPMPLPGQRAPNFELDAVVGEKVKKIKLSDYDGKWRVLCFYPADFTFV